MSKTDSGTRNNNYLNNFNIFSKVFKKLIEIMNVEIKNLEGTPTPKEGLF